jgi:HAD superfamily hydrolase (TIGR01459 family)
MTIHLPSRLADLAPHYEVVLCDIWGVLHNGRGAFPAAVAALQAFRAGGGVVVLISNVPKPRTPIFGQLEKLGCPASAYDAIVTSGDAIRAELRARAPGPYLKIGPPDDDTLWAGLGLAQTQDVEAAAFVAISGLDDPLRETPQDYRPRLARAKARGLSLLCANPDKLVRVGERLIWCAGAVAEVYAAMGGVVVMAGKPHAPIYALAMAEARALRPDFRTDRVLCIGDGVGTDVRGANAAGLDCLFIVDGVSQDLRAPDGALDIARIEAALAAQSAHAHFVMAGLA